MFGMSLFTWQPKYSVHHEMIDQQHRGLFRAADDLHAAMLRGAGRQIITATLAALLDYTEKHFRDEEQLMQKSSFPDFASHKAQHDKFTQQVKELRQAQEEGQMAVTVTTLQFLRDWLRDHIMGLDAKIARHIDGTGPAKVA